jgi:hypothetical protein
MDPLADFVFAQSPFVEDIATATFSPKELAAGFADLSNSIITEAVTRLRMFTISDPPRGGGPGGGWKFHYYDCLALGLYGALRKTDPFQPLSARRALAQQIASLLFGDPVTAEEAAERKAETAKVYERAARTPVGRAKFSGRMLKTHLARREEIRRDIYAASPFWWNRSATVNFFVFSCDGGKLVTICADEAKTPTLKMDMLEKIGARSWMNATRVFNEIDGQLDAIRALRSQARVEAE